MRAELLCYLFLFGAQPHLRALGEDIIRRGIMLDRLYCLCKDVPWDAHGAKETLCGLSIPPRVLHDAAVAKLCYSAELCRRQRNSSAIDRS
jgi:hypothetical protein